MADSTESSSSKTTEEAGEVHPQAKTASSEGGNVVTELVDAARATAEAVLDQQKSQIADSVSGMAEALRTGAERSTSNRRGARSKTSRVACGTRAGANWSLPPRNSRVTSRHCSS
jgi:hypothetical protein